MSIEMHLTHFEMVTAAIIGILSVARTARLIVHDVFPPMMWLRMKLLGLIKGPWRELLRCHFCISPWLAVGMAAWFYFSDAHWTWWVINGIWGLSYLSAMAVSYDQPQEPVFRLSE